MAFVNALAYKLILMITAQDIVELMAARGWKQKDLARACGVTQATVSRWLKGAIPDPPAQAKLTALTGPLAAAPGVQIQALLAAVAGSYEMLGLGKAEIEHLLKLVVSIAKEPPTPSAGPDYHRILAETAVRKFLQSSKTQDDDA